MTGKLHMSLGAYVGLTGGLFLMPDIRSKMIFMAGSIMGVLMPDIDTPTSTISKTAPLLPKVIHSCFGHRGFTHSPFCVFLLFLLFRTVDFGNWIYSFFMGFLIGYGMHLIQDFFTKGGIPLLFPFIKKKYSIGFLKSGSKFDTWIVKGISVIWTVLLITFCCRGSI